MTENCIRRKARFILRFHFVICHQKVFIIILFFNEQVFHECWARVIEANQMIKVHSNWKWLKWETNRMSTTEAHKKFVQQKLLICFDRECHQKKFVWYFAFGWFGVFVLGWVRLAWVISSLFLFNSELSIVFTELIMDEIWWKSLPFVFHVRLWLCSKRFYFSITGIFRMSHS